jgi:hypothetical protein
MPDMLDAVQEQLDRDYEIGMKRLGPYILPSGTAGVCDGCEEHFSRLIDGYCGRCRDNNNGFRSNRRIK